MRPKKSIPKVPKLDIPELPKLDLPKLELPKFPSLKPFSEDGFSFGQTFRPPLKRKDPQFEYVDTKPLKVSEEKPEDLYNLEKRPFSFEPEPPNFEPEPEVELTRPKRRRPVTFESEPFRPDFNFGNSPVVQRPGRQQVFNRFEESSRPNFNRFEETERPNFNRFEEQTRPESNRIESARPEFNRFEETPSRPKRQRPTGFNRFADSTFPELSRFEEAANRFARPSRPAFNKFSEPSQFEAGSRPGPAYQEDLDFNQVEKPQTRLKRKFPFNSQERPNALTERPLRGNRKRFPDERLKFRGLPARSYFEERESVGPGVYRTTTPRPIPTPGPMDFPRPPPRRPRPPPTHPTHPPPITHPPEHYETVTQRLPVSFNEIPQTKLTEISEYDEENNDYADDINSVVEEDEGFFAYPGTFPSLEDLGAGFESLKIRRNGRSTRRAKRSLDERDPLMTSEARRRRRIRRPGGNRRGIIDNRRSVYPLHTRAKMIRKFTF